MPPTREGKTERQPQETLPLGDRPRRRGPRVATVLAGLLAIGAAAAAVLVLGVAGGGGTDASELAGAPVDDGEVEALVQDFATAYGDEDGAELGRLLTRDAERVVPGARQEGRAEVLRAYRRQFQDSETRSFELSDLEVERRRDRPRERALRRDLRGRAGRHRHDHVRRAARPRDAADRADLRAPGPAGELISSRARRAA